MRDLRVSFPKPCDESWEAMTPAGRARLCARCDRAVHDLSQFEIGEAEALLRRDPGACVRARIGADGVVALKPGRSGARRMAMAVAATAGLLTAGAPALAKQDRPDGAIAGKVEFYGLRLRVTARGPDGRKFRATVRRDGEFRIVGVPAGTYTLTFAPDCGGKWTIENVVVDQGETRVPDDQ
ncbi:MAG TPA: carboxypeptidase-like regulatory domain-containing protein, partial [Allosphingosinicella sp.]